MDMFVVVIRYAKDRMIRWMRDFVLHKCLTGYSMMIPAQ